MKNFFDFKERICMYKPDRKVEEKPKNSRIFFVFEGKKIKKEYFFTQNMNKHNQKLEER